MPSHVQGVHCVQLKYLVVFFSFLRDLSTGTKQENHLLQYLALQVPYRVLVKAETFQKDKDNLARMAKVSLAAISSKSRLGHRGH